MRIIGGQYARRIIHPPAGLPVRPTTDKAKEALFNVLANYFDFEGLAVLDLFAGTGGISYEFASRGAAEVLAVEKHPRCVEFINKTMRLLALDTLRVVRTDAFRFIRQCPTAFDIIFADPPYEMEDIESIPDLIFKQKLLCSGGWLVLEHSGRHSFAAHPAFFQNRNYSKVHFTIFQEG